MINFIICDDNKEIREKVVDVVDSVMIKNDLEYTKHVYFDYNEKFEKEILSKRMANRIYILDIETPSRSGIDVARDIRKNDVESVIIFLSVYNNLGLTIINDEIMPLTFVNKLDNSEKKLESALNKALLVLGIKNVIRFKIHGVLYTIPSQDILYITRDSVERKLIIKTDYNEFKIKENLKDILSLLGKEFIETHRSCIVNMNRVAVIDKKKRVITFDNGETTDLLSNGYKKKIGV